MVVFVYVGINGVMMRYACDCGGFVLMGRTSHRSGKPCLLALEEKKYKSKQFHKSFKGLKNPSKICLLSSCLQSSCNRLAKSHLAQCSSLNFLCPQTEYNAEEVCVGLGQDRIWTSCLQRFHQKPKKPKKRELSSDVSVPTLCLMSIPRHDG